MAALLVLSSADAHPNFPTVAAATRRDDGGFGGNPPSNNSNAMLDGLTHQIHMVVMWGVQLIDKATRVWENFLDKFGLGGKRKNMPRRDFIDDGGNAVTKGVVRDRSTMDDGRRGPDFDKNCVGNGGTGICGHQKASLRCNLL